MMSKSYSELITLETFLDRFEYLKLSGGVGAETFGFDRYLNQLFYKLAEWNHTRRKVIIRDEGRDLGIPGRDIFGTIYVHHINPITLDQVKRRDPSLFDPEFLICTSFTTHNGIHYGDETSIIKDPVDRTPDDTKLW